MRAVLDSDSFWMSEEEYAEKGLKVTKIIPNYSIIFPVFRGRLT